MSEQISKELLKIMNSISDMENTISKIDAAIFIKKSNKIIQEKVAYLYSIIQAEGNFYGQSEIKHQEEIELIIGHYKQKLNMVYDEFYCQYANIQNEKQEASLNKNIAMINYQKLVNKIDSETQISLKEVEKAKNSLKEKNEVYNKIINKCEEKFGICKAKFEKRINDDFLVISKLQVMNDKNIFQKIKCKIKNLFSGNQKYTQALGKYNQKVDKIDAVEIVTGMREETIDFVAEILELRSKFEPNIAV